MKPSAIFKAPLTLNLKPLTLISKRSKAMKAKIFVLGLLFAVIFFCSLGYSQVPPMINYQGKVTDEAGNLLNGNYDMIFSIHEDSIGGTALWTETQVGVPVENGIFSVLLGSATVGGIPFEVFDGNIRYLEVQVGSDVMTPRKEMVSVPYAMHRWPPEPDLDWDYSTNPPHMFSIPTGNVGIGTSEPQNKLDVEGGVAVGASYSGTNTAPENGMIIEGNVGIGTTDPGSLREGVLTVQGLGIAGKTSASPYPTFQQMNFSHDNVSLNFDSYYGGISDWTSSDVGSNFQIYKVGDKLRFRYKSGVDPGDRIYWNEGFVLDIMGNVGIGTTTPESRLHAVADNDTLPLDAVYGVSDSLTGVIGESNSDDSSEAGVRGIGNGTAGPGILQAAALDIQSGGIIVSGSPRPAGKIPVSGDWDLVYSCPDEGHEHGIGQYIDITLTNCLITTKSIILLTVESMSDQPCFAQVRDTYSGYAEIRVTAVDCTAPDSTVWVNYLIINSQVGITK